MIACVDNYGYNTIMEIWAFAKKSYGMGKLLFKQVNRNMKKEYSIQYTVYSIHNRYLILYSLIQ